MGRLGKGIGLALSLALVASPVYAKTVQVRTEESSGGVEVGSPIVYVNGSLLVPVQELFNGLEFSVSVSGGTVEVSLGEVSAKFTELGRFMSVDVGGRVSYVELNQAMVRVNERLCVPLESVEALGYVVSWDGDVPTVSGGLVTPSVVEPEPEPEQEEVVEESIEF